MSGGLHVLGIDVSAELVGRWAEWLAPERQPFLVAPDDPLHREDSVECPLEIRDTFELYGLSRRGLALVWLTEDEFEGLPRGRRADLVRGQARHGRGAVPTVRRWRPVLGDQIGQQADGHRFVWWPSLLDGHRDGVLRTFVTNDRLPSRHAEVPEPVWRTAASLLPGARRLAGTFPSASGPNCFSTVMAAAGAAGPEGEWSVTDPFEDWLAASSRRGGRNDDPGTVLVWRSADGTADHAAVTLGGGWAMHKPSQGWMSPCKVLTVRDVLRRGGARDLRLQRRSLLS